MFFVGDVGDGAGLSRQFKGNSVAVRFTNDNLLLVNNVNTINQFSNIETSLFNNIFADNFSKHNILDDTGGDRSGVGQINSDVKGLSDKGDFVGLSLVFLSAYLMFTLVMITIAGSFAIRDFHGFGLFLISHLLKKNKFK